ncbi:MAG: formyl transferase [Acidobacteriota bacterium]|nr:MAG: formyl transferase [Acidobacteriota bacterium]
MARKKIVILAAPGVSTNILFHAIDDLYPVERVILEQPVSRMEFLRWRVKRLGLLKVLGQVLFQVLIVPVLNINGSKRIRRIIVSRGLNDSSIDPGRVSRVASANADETIGILRSAEPDLVIINGTRILSERVLSSISAPFINIHAGITPLYRGVHGAYWALVEDDPESCGVTVHLVDKGIDTGGILAQERIYPGDDDNFDTYPILQLAAGINALYLLLPDILEGRINRLDPPGGPSRLWSHPTFLQYLRDRFFRGVK